MTIVSDAFAVLARAEAAGLGLPELPILVVPHPVAGRSRQSLLAEGTSLAEDAAAALLASAEHRG